MYNGGASPPVKDRQNRRNLRRVWTTLLFRTGGWRYVGKGEQRRHKTANSDLERQTGDCAVDEESGLKDGSSPPLTPVPEPHLTKAKVRDNTYTGLIQDGGTAATITRENSHPSPGVAYVALILNGLGVIQAGYGPGSCTEVKSMIKQLILNPSEPILPGNRYMAILGGYTVHLFVNRENR